jgi:predicted nuclease of predicted toxin-antitoxin system
MGTLSSELGPILARTAGDPRVYADANVPLGLVTFMRHHLRWDVYFVLEHADLRRAPDIAHFRLARDMRRTLVSLDRDYIDDRRFPRGESGGVVVLTAPDTRRFEEVLRRIDRRLLRPGHPESLLAPTAGPDLPLAGQKVYAHVNWP